MKFSLKFFSGKTQPRNSGPTSCRGRSAPVPYPPFFGRLLSQRLPCPQGRAEAVLTSRKRFQYLSRSYWETVLSHWSLSRKLPLLGPAPPASASRCRLSTWRKHHAAAAAASTAIAGICGAGGTQDGELGGQGDEPLAGHRGLSASATGPSYRGGGSHCVDRVISRTPGAPVADLET